MRSVTRARSPGRCYLRIRLGGNLGSSQVAIPLEADAREASSQSVDNLVGKDVDKWAERWNHRLPTQVNGDAWQKAHEESLAAAGYATWHKE